MGSKYVSRTQILSINFRINYIFFYHTIIYLKRNSKYVSTFLE